MIRPSRAFAICLAAWAGIVVLFLAPLATGDRVLAPLDLLDGLLRPWSEEPAGSGVHNQATVDAVRQHIPYDWAVFDSLRRDGFAGWDPCSYGGRALAENTMLCPGDWHHLLYLALPFWPAWNLGIALQLAIAGAGMLVLLRSERRASADGRAPAATAALLGAAAFAFYSQNVAWLHHRFVLGCACFLPWLAWSLRRAVRAGRRFSPSAVLFAALALRGGSLQTCLYVALLGAGLLAAEVPALPCGEARRRAAGRILALFASAALGAALLFAPVALRTVPACLAGARELHRWTWGEMLLSIPTLATSLVPTLAGTPQTLDGFKAFHQHVFFVRYAGGVPLCLALAAFARRDAPLAPKILFAGSIALHFTPLNTWLYNRSTVLFALGLAWLAAWELPRLREGGRRPWNILFGAFLAALALWAAAGAALTACGDTPGEWLRALAARSLPPEKAFRLPWILERADRFLAAFPPWSRQNLAFLVPLAAGLLLCRRLAAPLPLAPRPAAAARGAVLACALAELFAFSRLWLTFSPAPPASEHGPFADADWTAALRAETQGAGYVWIHSAEPDEDFFTRNVHSGFGLRLLDGSDTVAPVPRLPKPVDPGAFDPGAFARAGVSHVVVNPRFPVPDALAAWTRVPLPGDRFPLFRNPAFESISHAVLADGARVPLAPAAEERNHLRFELPAGAVAFERIANNHPGWRASLESGPNAQLPTLPGDPGLRVDLPGPLPVPSTLRLDFHP